MNLTKSRLKQIIKEELANILLQEQGKPVPKGTKCCKCKYPGQKHCAKHATVEDNRCRGPRAWSEIGYNPYIDPYPRDCRPPPPVPRKPAPGEKY